jgi:predicted RNA-binding protein with PIN domain
VVTSDNVERQIVETLGATCLSAEAFAVEVEVALRELARNVRQHSRAGHLGRVRDSLDG